MFGVIIKNLTIPILQLQLLILVIFRNKNILKE